MTQPEDTADTWAVGTGIVAQLLLTKRLLPLSFGMACAHLSIVVVNDYCISKADMQGLALLGDMPNILLAIVLLLIFFATLRRGRFSEKTIERMSIVACAFAGIALISLDRLWAVGLGENPLVYSTLSLLVLACSTWGTFYWMHKVAGSSSLATSVFCFAAILVSTTFCGALGLFAWGDRFLICAVFQAAQLVLLVFVRQGSAPHKDFPLTAQGFFPSYRGRNFTEDLLATIGISLFCISVPLGMGQAYIGWWPEAPPVAALVLVLVVLAALAIFWIRFTIVKDASTRVMRFWMIAQMFILAAVICNVALPELSLPGAVLMRSSSLFICGFTWFITIAFINYGWRAQIYYCIAGWFSFSFSQMVGRDISHLVFDAGLDATIMLAVMAGFLLVADQLLLARYYSLINMPQEGGHVPLSSPKLLHGIMGLASTNGSTSNEPTLDQRREALMEKARLMGKQYLLNEREVEIIALYVLGFTHRKISEEVHLSSESVHTYIKRIYKKTNLHSRQELIDYINEYLS